MAKGMDRSLEVGICLIAGFGLTLAVRFGAPWISALGQWTVAIFLLRAAKLLSGWRGYLAIAFTLTLAIFVTQRGVIPMPLPAFAVVAILNGLVAALAYAGDRNLAARLPDWAAPLFFPARLTAVAYVGSQFSPFGTWGNPAYGAGLSGFWSLVAITGLWGVDFLIGWLAAAANSAWEKGLSKGYHALGPWLVVSAIVLGFSWALPGGHSGPQLRVAAITPTPQTPGLLRCHGDPACERNLGNKRQEELFARSEAATRLGARLIAWSEGALQVLQKDEPALRLRATRFAAAHGVYLFAGVVTVLPGPAPLRLENKIIAVTPSGVVWDYHKSKAVPGEPIESGSGIVPTLQTPWGRVAALICFDADFPKLVRQAGKARADILLVSANDWAAIATRHAEMARFRAVENGVTLVRAAAKGQSTFVDSHGQVLLQNSDSLVVGTIPLKRGYTFYPVIGDAFAWLCLAAVMLVSGLRLSQRGITLMRARTAGL